MDGLVGTHGLEGLCGPRGFAEVLPLMDAQYRKLDGRFNMSFGEQASARRLWLYSTQAVPKIA